EIDRGQFKAASSSLKVALAGKPESWAQLNAASLAQAYLDYRQGDIRQARQWLKRSGRSPGAPQQAFVAQLERSIDRREAELAYARGAIPVAAKAIAAARRADPLNPWVLHNAACVDYRRRNYKDAAETWEKVAHTIPEAV